MATAEEKALWALPLWELDTVSDCAKAGLPISTVHPGMIIEWGDGSRITVASADDYVHEYETPGKYHIVVRYDAWETVELAISSEADVPSPLAEARTSIAVVNRLPAVANESFAYLFYNYTGLLDLANDLFDAHGDKTDFSYTFAGCTNLMLVPDHIFHYVPKAVNFTGTFAGCASITEVPELLFAETTEATTFTATFSDCTALTAISEMAFAGMSESATFTATFSNCTALAAVSEQLLATMSLSAEQALEAVFSGCTSLKFEPVLGTGTVEAAGEAEEDDSLFNLGSSTVEAADN